MSKTISFTVLHHLSAVEARDRLRSFLENQLADAGASVKANQQWDDHSCSFDVAAMGMTVKGTVEFRDGGIDVSAQIPGMVPRKMAEKLIRETLEPLLA